MIKLKAKIKVKESYKGKTVVGFWNNLLPGDIIELSTHLQKIYRGQSGLKATCVTLNNLRSYESVTYSMTNICKCLKNLEFEECE